MYEAETGKNYVISQLHIYQKHTNAVLGGNSIDK
jgi:hypothetical protein